MAIRRRGKSPAISTAGRAEAAPNPAPDESFQRPIEPVGEYGKAEPEAVAESSQHFSSGLGQQLADMRQQQQNDALDAYISAYFPGALPHERVPRQSPEFLQAIGMLIDQHHAAAMQAQAAPPPMPSMPSIPPTTHVDIEKTESPEGEPESAHMDAHFVSAPVSRGDSGHAVEPQLTPSQIRLSPEERELCQMNKIDEVKYAEGKLRLAKQKAAKLRD